MATREEAHEQRAQDLLDDVIASEATGIALKRSITAATEIAQDSANGVIAATYDAYVAGVSAGLAAGLAAAIQMFGEHINDTEAPDGGE